MKNNIKYICINIIYGNKNENIFIFIMTPKREPFKNGKFEIKFRIKQWKRTLLNGTLLNIQKSTTNTIIEQCDTSIKNGKLLTFL